MADEFKFTPETQRVINAAMQRSGENSEEYIGTGYVLFFLIDQPGLGEKYGLDREKIRGFLKRILIPFPPNQGTSELSYSPRFRRVLGIARYLAVETRKETIEDVVINEEDLLCAIAKEGIGTGVLALEAEGYNLKSIEEKYFRSNGSV